MTLQQLRYLTAVSRYNSISKAARALYITQPGISKAIHELEAELDIVILERTNKGVLFTAAGCELLDYAQLLLAQADAVAEHFHPQQERTIRFSVASQHYGFVIAAVAQFMNLQRTSSYELTVREGRTADVIREVASGRSIAGVISVNDFNKNFFKRFFRENDVTFTAIDKSWAHVFLRRCHPLAGKTELTLAQLQDYPYLTYQRNDPLLQCAEEAVDIDGLRQVVYLEDRGAMNDILANTDGYNIGTGCIVRNYMNEDIVSIPLAGEMYTTIGVVKRRDVFFSAAVQQYIDLLQSALRKSLPSDSLWSGAARINGNRERGGMS